MLPNKKDENIVAFLVKIVRSAIEMYGDIFNLAYLEACLARKSLILIIGLLVLAVIGTGAIWISVMILFYWLLSPTLGNIGASLVITVGNIVLTLGMLFIVKSLLKNLEFAKTRAQLKVER